MAPILLQGVAAVVVAAGVAMVGRRALRKGASIERIDPFTLTDPWRSYVQDAQSARTRFVRIVDSVEKGPLEERLSDIEASIGEGVSACWRIAQSGHQLHKMVLEVSRSPSESVDRMRGREADTSAKLAALVRNLNEAVARAAELATSQYRDLDAVADDVNGVVSDLEALRQGIAEISGA
jgi:hypothetical protein